VSHVRSTSTKAELTAQGAQERGDDALVELRPGAALELGLSGFVADRRTVAANRSKTTKTRPPTAYATRMSATMPALLVFAE